MPWLVIENIYLAHWELALLCHAWFAHLQHCLSPGFRVRCNTLILDLIRVCLTSSSPNVAVFDSTFHTLFAIDQRGSSQGSEWAIVLVILTILAHQIDDLGSAAGLQWSFSAFNLCFKTTKVNWHCALLCPKQYLRIFVVHLRVAVALFWSEVFAVVHLALCWPQLQIVV